jgi:hypothetical protein
VKRVQWAFSLTYLSFPLKLTVEVMPHKKRSTAERTESSQNLIVQSEKRVKNSRIRIERANTKRLVDIAAIEARHEKKAAMIEEMKAALSGLDSATLSAAEGPHQVTF